MLYQVDCEGAPDWAGPTLSTRHGWEENLGSDGGAGVDSAAPCVGDGVARTCRGNVRCDKISGAMGVSLED